MEKEFASTSKKKMAFFESAVRLNITIMTRLIIPGLIFKISSKCVFEFNHNYNYSMSL